VLGENRPRRRLGNRTTVYPNDTEGLHKLAWHLMRAPVNLSRLRFDRDSRRLVYEPKPGHELDDDALTDPLESLARVLTHIPEPNKHLVHFYGAYAIAFDNPTDNRFVSMTKLGRPQLHAPPTNDGPSSSTVSTRSTP
jgi:hypothetical protein